MENQLSGTNSEERRRFFRIEDEIKLFYRVLHLEDIPEEDEIKDQLPDAFSLSGVLEYLTQQSRALLKKFERDLPELTDYLKILDQKVDLLAQAILLNAAEISDQPTRNVNLSASGLAFEVETKIDPDEYIELKLILPPSFLALLTYGKVVYCEAIGSDDERYPYRIGVDFLKMREKDKEMLIRHVVKKQMHQIRERKKST